MENSTVRSLQLIAANAKPEEIGVMAKALPSKEGRRLASFSEFESGLRTAVPGHVAGTLARALAEWSQSRAVVEGGFVRIELRGVQAGRFGTVHQVSPEDIWKVFRDAHPNIIFPETTTEDLLVAFKARLNKKPRPERWGEVGTSVNGMASSLAFY